MATRCLGRRWTRKAAAVWMMVLVTGTLVLASIKPLRNAVLYPVWPSQWRPVGSYRILERHVVDLFYPMDRHPYSGPCQDVHSIMHTLGILQKAAQLFHDFQVHVQDSWDLEIKKVISLKLRLEPDTEQISPDNQHHLDPDALKNLDSFRPALTEKEQRILLRNIFVATSALEAFNVSYMAAEGTLIGSLRHRGIIPWDDDADLTFRADQWPVAKRVLSCIPGYEVKIYSDFLWKFYALDSPFWKGETSTRFPYVDLFPYVEDEDYVWPLIIWLKDKMLWPRGQVFPTRLVPFHNFQIRVPNDVVGVLRHLFGDVSVCESRLFERREKRLTTQEERVRIPCSLLAGIYTIYDWQDTDNSTS